MSKSYRNLVTYAEEDNLPAFRRELTDRMKNVSLNIQRQQERKIKDNFWNKK